MYSREPSDEDLSTRGGAAPRSSQTQGDGEVLGEPRMLMAAHFR